MVYLPLKPQSNDNLSISQGDIQQNFQTANNVMAVDHLPFDNVSGQEGYHTIIHQVKQLVDPAAIAGVNQIYSKDYTPDTNPASTADVQLFSRTGGGGISQMTGNRSASEGWCWLGGIMIQWGTVTRNMASPKDDSHVTFKTRQAGCQPFPNSCFSVYTTNIADGTKPGSQMSVSIENGSIDRLRFDWSSFTNSSDYKGFYWVAIGN